MYFKYYHIAEVRLYFKSNCIHYILYIDSNVLLKLTNFNSNNNAVHFKLRTNCVTFHMSFIMYCVQNSFKEHNNIK